MWSCFNRALRLSCESALRLSCDRALRLPCDGARMLTELCINVHHRRGSRGSRVVQKEHIGRYQHNAHEIDL